jgi:hypothetical protein
MLVSTKVLLFIFVSLFITPSIGSWLLAHHGPTPCVESSSYTYMYDSQKFWKCTNETNHLQQCTKDESKCVSGGAKDAAGVISFYGNVFGGKTLFVTIQVGTSEEGGVATTLSLPPGFSFYFGYSDCEFLAGNVTCYTDTYYGITLPQPPSSPLSPSSSFRAFGSSMFLLKSFEWDTPVSLSLISSNPSHSPSTPTHTSFTCRRGVVCV